MLITKTRLTLFNATTDICKQKNETAMAKFVEGLFSRLPCKMAPGIYCKNNTKVMELKEYARYIKLFGTGKIRFREVLTHEEVSIELSKLV